MANAITVKELGFVCDQLKKEGYGDQVVLLSDDDEGNGYHTLFYTFLTDKKMIKELADSGMFHDNNDPDEVVILG